MVHVERYKEQTDLIFKLGLLLRPLYDIVNFPEQHNAGTRSRIWAKFSVEVQNYRGEFDAFSKGEKGHYYERENKKFGEKISSFKNIPDEKLDDYDEFRKRLDEFSYTLREIILTIPVITDGTILESNTPFSTYSLLKDLFLATSKNLILIDRYLDDTIFYRYFRNIHETVCATVITWPEER